MFDGRLCGGRQRSRRKHGLLQRERLDAQKTRQEGPSLFSEKAARHLVVLGRCSLPRHHTPKRTIELPRRTHWPRRWRSGCSAFGEVSRRSPGACSFAADVAAITAASRGETLGSTSFNSLLAATAKRTKYRAASNSWSSKLSPSSSSPKTSEGFAAGSSAAGRSGRCCCDGPAVFFRPFKADATPAPTRPPMPGAIRLPTIGSAF